VGEVSKWCTGLGTRVGGVRVTQRYMYPRLGTREGGEKSVSGTLGWVPVWEQSVMLKAE